MMDVTRKDIEKYRADLAEIFAVYAVHQLEKEGIIVAETLIPVLTSAILLDDDDVKGLIIAEDAPSHAAAMMINHVLKTLKKLSRDRA